MASGITTAQQLQDVLDAIHDNISQMDVYQGLSELGSLRLCWNDISRTATIFKRINDEENREEVVCTFNPENIVIGTDTFQGKMLKNIVHNATTTVTRSNDVGLGGYVGLKTLIRNICAALGVNLAPNFDEVNPTIYGELVNIVKKYYGDSLQNNAPYGLARKDTTSGNTTTTTYNSYIPVMIIVDIAIYLNGLGVFNVGSKKLYRPIPMGSETDPTILNVVTSYYDFMNLTEFKTFYKEYVELVITGNGYSTDIEHLKSSIDILFNLYYTELDFENYIYSINYSGGTRGSGENLEHIFTIKLYGIKNTCKVTDLSSNGVIYFYNDIEDFDVKTYTCEVVYNYNYTTETITNNKTTDEKAKDTLYTITINELTNRVAFNYKCNKYIKPYYNGSGTEYNRFNTQSGESPVWEFVSNLPALSSENTYNNLKFLSSDILKRVGQPYEFNKLLGDTQIVFDDSSFCIIHNTDSGNYRNFDVFVCSPTSVRVTTSGYPSNGNMRPFITNTYNNICKNINSDGYIYLKTPYTAYYNYNNTYTYNFLTGISITKYTVTRVDNDTPFSISNTEKYTSDNISIKDRSNYIVTNIGELVEIQETDELAGITLQDNATYPSAVIDYNTFNTTYPNWGKIGYSQPYFEEDQIAGTYTAQWAAISVDSDTPTSQADSQAGEIDFTDTDLVDDIIDDIDNADDGNDEEEVDPNSDEIEGEGETPDDELDRIEPNVLTGGFVKQYALTAAQMQELATCLTNPDLLQTVVRAFRDPMQAIVSLQLAYKTPTLTSPTDIILYGFDWSSLTNKPKGYPLATNIINFDFGTLHIDPLYNTYQDITTTSIELYLPCVGFIPLNPAEFLDRGLDVEGKIDTLSGTIVYDISAYDGTKRKLLYQKTGNCQLQLPISSNDNSTIFGALMGVGGMALGGFTGNPLLMAQSAAMTGASMAQGPNYEHGGSISANAGLMTKMIPCVIIKRNQVYNPTHLNELHGLPANSYVKLGSCSGYTVVQDVKVDIQGATQIEKSQIETLLKGGVIL